MSKTKPSWWELPAWMLPSWTFVAFVVYTAWCARWI
jgi:hypothetical protein